MLKNRKTLMGCAVAAVMLAGAGMAQAQDYYDGEGYRPAVSETVIVSPRFDRLETHNVVGRVDGEINPTIVSISHPVSYADLDLRYGDDVAQLRDRIRSTAYELCDRLADHYSDMRDSSDQRQCVRDAVRDAMAQVPIYPAG